MGALSVCLELQKNTVPQIFPYLESTKIYGHLRQGQKRILLLLQKEQCHNDRESLKKRFSKIGCFRSLQNS